MSWRRKKSPPPVSELRLYASVVEFGTVLVPLDDLPAEDMRLYLLKLMGADESKDDFLRVASTYYYGPKDIVVRLSAITALWVVDR